MTDLFDAKDEPVTTTAIATVAATDSNRLMLTIERAATDPNFDVDKLRAMLDMKVQMDAMAAEQEYNLAMKACQEEMRPVVRDKKGERGKYASLEQLHAICKPIWLAHGFSLSSHSEVSPMQGHYRIVTTCRHDAGHKTTHFLDAPPDDSGPKGEKNKTPIQALGSTVSYVRRYLDLMIFDITIEGEDRDGARAPTNRPKLSDQQSLEMQAFIADHNMDPMPLLKWKGVERLGDIAAADFDDCMGRLRHVAKKQEAARAFG